MRTAVAPPITSELVEEVIVSLLMPCNFTSSPSVSSDYPDVLELLKLEIPQRVGKKCELFGIALLDDKTGVKMETIVEDCRGATEKIVLTVLRKWIQGNGVEMSWESLVKTLRDCKLSLFATQIEMALKLRDK